MRISEKWKDRAQDAQAFLEVYEYAIGLENVVDQQKAMGDEIIKQLNQVKVELAELQAEQAEPVLDKKAKKG